MGDQAGQLKNEFLDALVGRPGWRLEPRSTPGAPPIWCFVFNGKIEFSVTAEEDKLIHLYLMETDREITFRDADELTSWLRTHRSEALQDPLPKVASKSRFRDVFRWD